MGAGNGVLSVSQTVVEGREFKHLRRRPGRGLTQLMMWKCGLGTNGGLRLASELSQVKQRHGARKTVDAGGRGTLWEISPGDLSGNRRENFLVTGRGVVKS